MSTKNYSRPKTWHRNQTLILFVLCVTTFAVAAHHSYGAFDTESTRTVTGSVVEFSWTNPHVSLAVVVDGSPESNVWQFEGMSPDWLGRRGWNRRTLEPGDAVTIDFYPRRDGSRGGLLISVTEADGTARVMIVTED